MSVDAWVNLGLALFGLFVGLTGYRFYRFTAFLHVFVAGSLFGIFAGCDYDWGRAADVEFGQLHRWSIRRLCWFGSMAGASFILGCIVSRRDRVGGGCVGMVAGALLGTLSLFISTTEWGPNATLNGVYFWMGGGALLFLALGCKFPKGITILGSSITGTYVSVMLGVGHFFTKPEHERCKEGVRQIDLCYVLWERRSANYIAAISIYVVSFMAQAIMTYRYSHRKKPTEPNPMDRSLDNIQEVGRSEAGYGTMGDDPPSPFTSRAIQHNREREARIARDEGRRAQRDARRERRGEERSRPAPHPQEPPPVFETIAPSAPPFEAVEEATGEGLYPSLPNSTHRPTSPWPEPPPVNPAYVAPPTH